MLVERTRRTLPASIAALAALVWAVPISGQELSDFDYENLSFRGIGLSIGGTVPSKVVSTASFGGRLDLGYLGPSVRLLPTFNYWSSDFEGTEVAELENQLLSLINRSLPTGQQISAVDLGDVTWSDLVIGLDAHVVWAVPSYQLLTYAGAGIAAHVLNGEGAAIRDTFVEDLLDRITAGLNAHLGAEYPISDRLRGYGEARFEILEDLHYFEFRLGLQLMFLPMVPPELGGG